MRHNGIPFSHRVRVKRPPEKYLVRLTCMVCDSFTVRGSERPFCLRHSDYANKIRAEIAAGAERDQGEQA